MKAPSHRFLLASIATLLSLAGCGRPVSAPSQPDTARPAIGPIVAGLTHPGIDARLHGLVLLGELGCVACHAQADGAPPVDARIGPDLASVGRRARGEFLAEFLAEPHRAAPGSVMPDLLRGRTPQERAAAAAALAAYLRSFASFEADDEVGDAAAEARGRVLFHGIGCAVCHAPRDAQGAALPVAGSVPLDAVPRKYSRRSLRSFLLDPHEARPAARMPDLHLTPAEARDVSHYLLAGAPPVAAEPALAAAPSAVAAGRRLFGELGCVRCHALEDPARVDAPRSSAPLHGLDAARGCMSDAVGSWPFYPLSIDQRAAIRAALAAGHTLLAEEAQVQQALVARNCVGCHQRGELGGVAIEREALFGTDDPNLGPEARLPPPLTGVGAKLQVAWLRDAIAHGQTARPYVHTRMPGFGAALADRLAPLLERVDALPLLEVAPLPEDDKARREVLDLGRELVGDKGMNCITCHRFAGEQVGTMGAIDLVESTGQRLRPQWFAHFLRQPFAFKPNTLMPQFFPNGVSTRPELGGGDVARQVDAMWHYLAEGRNVRQPNGMRRPPIELQVADEAVVLRRSVQHTGKRGISVGYPGGVNLTFDAERLGMNQVWWGQFVDASPVWTGQGSGQARILGKRRAELPNGPAIVALADVEAPWPEASRRELGQRWLGYDLDAQQRPTFRYECAGVEVADAAREQDLEGLPGVSLRRTLRFSGGDADLWFLVARDARVEPTEPGVVRVGAALQLRLSPAACRIVDRGDVRELRVPVALRGGRAEVVIDYSWLEERK